MYKFSNAINLINKEIWAIEIDIRNTIDDRRYTELIEKDYVNPELKRLAELVEAREVLRVHQKEEFDAPPEA